MVRKLYQHIAGLLDARLRCSLNNNGEWTTKHAENLRMIASSILPSGSGIDDDGTKIDIDRSTGERIVLTLGFHHMDDNGFYDGWSDHTITVRASLIHDISLTIGGPNRNAIKDYLHDRRRGPRMLARLRALDVSQS
jgi:hypothetical protein